MYWTNSSFQQLALVSPRFSIIKWKGDYRRCLAEFATGNDRKEAAESSLVAYKAASDIAMTELPPKHPICLGLALNFSVFYYAILNSPDCMQVGKSSFWWCNCRTGHAEVKKAIRILHLSCSYYVIIWHYGLQNKEVLQDMEDENQWDIKLNKRNHLWPP